MKKQELLKYIDNEFLDKLFGFCYVRTNDSYDAEELCSDIIFELLNIANTSGEIENVYPFIWKVARNVYSRFSEKRKQSAERYCDSDYESMLLDKADEDGDESESQLSAIYKGSLF